MINFINAILKKNAYKIFNPTMRFFGARGFLVVLCYEVFLIIMLLVSTFLSISNNKATQELKKKKYLIRLMNGLERR